MSEGVSAGHPALAAPPAGMERQEKLLAAALLGLALAALMSVIEIDNAFAELSPALQDAAGAESAQRAFSRSIADSVSVASTFGDQGVRIPRVFNIGISDGLTITPSPSSPTGSAAASPSRTNSFTGAGRAEEKLGPRSQFESRDPAGTSATNGTMQQDSQEDASYDIETVLSMVGQELFSSDDSEPDDSSSQAIVQPALYMDALYGAYGFAVIVFATSRTSAARSMARHIAKSSEREVTVTRAGHAVVLVAAGMVVALAASGGMTSTYATRTTPTYVGDGGPVSGTGPIIPALPSSLQNDDILLLFIETANDANIVVTPNGGNWLEVTNSPQHANGGSLVTSTRLTVYWTRYDGSQVDPTVEDSVNHQTAVILAFRGVVTSGDPWDVTSGAVETSADTSGSIPLATTTVDNTLVVLAISTSLPDANGSTNFSSWSNANLANLTERFDITSNAGNGGGIGIATGEKATAGATGATSVTVGSSASKGMMTIALKAPNIETGAPSDTLTISDSVDTAVAWARNTSETLSVGDALSVNVALTIPVSDSVAVGDAASRLLGASRAPSETLAAADSIAFTTLRFVPVSESLSVTEGIATSVSRQISDTLGVSDEAARSASVSKSVSESLAAADSVAADRLVQASISDTLALSDAAAATRSTSATIADSLSVADSPARTLVASRAAEDGITITDGVTKRVSRSMSDALGLDEDIARGASRLLQDGIAASDSASGSHLTPRSVSDAVALADAATTGFGPALSDSLGIADEPAVQKALARSLSETLAVADSVAVNVSQGRATADALAASDGISTAAAYARAIEDSVPVQELIREQPRLRDTLEISDSVAPGLYRSIADGVAVGEEIDPPITGALRELSDAVTAADSFEEISVQWNRSFEEEVSLGDCTPFSCNPMLNLGESLSLGDEFSGPPEVEDTISITDSISTGRSYATAPEESLSVSDSAGFAMELAPPAAPEGVPELGAVAATGTDVVDPLPAQAVTGTYSMESGNADDLADQLDLPAVDISAITDWSQLVLVLQTYYVALTPSYLVPADDSMMTITVSEIPADTRVLVPVSIEGTSEASEHGHIPWMTVEYVPAVDSNNFALLITPLEQPPDDEPVPSADMVPLYLNVRWVGDFDSGDPGVSSYYAEAPTFTFALTEEWADENDAERDEIGVPAITLNLLDESTGEWQAVSDVDVPTATNDDGEYVYVAHLEHFSTYAVTVEEAAVSGGGGGGGRDRFEAGLEESLAVADSARARAVEIIEEPAGIRYSATLQDSLGIASRPVAYKVLPVREDLDVLIALQQVSQHTGIPPSAKATFEVNVSNAGDAPQSFVLKLWYNDDKGVRAFESSQEIAVGARESRQELAEVVFGSPGTFEVTVEARSMEGDLLNTTQMTVEVPWLTVNLWLLVVVALAIIGESVAMVLYLLRRRKVALTVGGQAVVLPRHKVRVSMAAWPEHAKAGDLQVSVRLANSTAKRVLSGTLAEVEFEIRNTSDSPQEFILSCWFEHGPDSWYQRVQLGPRGSDLRRAEVSMPSRGRHMLHAEVRDAEYGELLGMLRIGALSY